MFQLLNPTRSLCSVRWHMHVLRYQGVREYSSQVRLAGNKFPEARQNLMRRDSWIPTPVTIVLSQTRKWFIRTRHFNTSAHTKSRAKLPFEVDANVPKDVTIFSYRNDRLYSMITVFGIIQFIFWGNLAFFTHSSFKRVADGEMKINTDSSSGKILGALSQYSSKIAVMAMLLGNLVLFFSLIYPQRTISKLILLRGGDNVRITTYAHFGRTRDFNVPLKHISCHQSRTADSVNTSLKIKGKWMYYLMDKQHGTFHDPKLFDHVVGLQRNLKK